jgi:peroxiredoxin
MKRYGIGALVLASAFLLALAAWKVPVAKADAFVADTPAVRGSIGETVGDFRLPDAKGAEHTLSSLRGKNGTVLIFVAVQCPVSNAYNARMEKLAQDYKARGINVVGINANASESVEDIARHASEKSLTFTILKDKDNRIADLLGALVTPEAYVLDTGSKIVYRGRIDNSRSGDAITSNDLRDALDQMLSGKQVTKSEARAFGCSIKRVS